VAAKLETAPEGILSPGDEAAARAALAKARVRLLPFLFLLYIANYLDRINVSFAALQMNHELGLKPVAFGLGSGLFFIGYIACEVPSNLVLERVGARRWIARIMISWGLISSATMFAQGARSFYVLRLLLGAAEAGFFPGIIFYLTYWFPRRERARASALFLTATALAGLIAGPLCGAILGMQGILGLSGWQWLFLLEGIPSVILGLVVLYYLPDGPAQARWLSSRERESLAMLLHWEYQENAGAHRHTLRQGLASLRVWTMGAIYFCIVVTIYGVAFWLPQIVKGLGTFSNLEIGFLSTLPYFCAAAVMVLVGISSDRSGERRWHLALAAFVGSIGLMLSAQAKGPVLALVALSLAAAGLWATLGPFWSMPPEFLRGTAAAGGIALINSLGNAGGFVGPFLMGFLKELTRSFNGGLQILALALACAGLIVLLTYRGQRQLVVTE
jgi:ACS family tartrate transporter-like MFS transporter